MKKNRYQIYLYLKKFNKNNNVVFNNLNKEIKLNNTLVSDSNADFNLNFVSPLDSDNVVLDVIQVDTQNQQVLHEHTKEQETEVFNTAYPDLPNFNKDDSFVFEDLEVSKTYSLDDLDLNFKETQNNQEESQLHLNVEEKTVENQQEFKFEDTLGNSQSLFSSFGDESFSFEEQTQDESLKNNQETPKTEVESSNEFLEHQEQSEAVAEETYHLVWEEQTDTQQEKQEEILTPQDSQAFTLEENDVQPLIEYQEYNQEQPQEVVEEQQTTQEESQEAFSTQELQQTYEELPNNPFVFEEDSQQKENELFEDKEVVGSELHLDEDDKYAKFNKDFENQDDVFEFIETAQRIERERLFYKQQEKKNHKNVQKEDGVAFDSISKNKKPKIKILNSRKNFNFEEFEKNVKYKTFADGTTKKIAAEIDNVRLTFTNPSKPTDKPLVLRNTSVQFYEGEVHAIIGESGSGKSVITSLLYGLAGKNANIEEGRILLYNNEVQDFRFKDWQNSRYLGKVISAVFQNPMSTLNPTMKIGNQIMEGMLINGIVKNRREAKQKAIEYLKLTKINNPAEVMDLYPHELSGGMIQRVVIASIVSLHPKILVLDEPTTALDPTVQALVLDIIRELQEQFKMCVIFITHDLGVVASIANYISIMYAGQIIEEGTRDEILWNPQHPYTWGLISSMPDVNKGDRLSTIKGSVPSRLNDIVGDAFAIRNDYALVRDFVIEPKMYYVSETHRAKTALLDERAPKYEPPAIIKEKWAVFKQRQEGMKG